MTPRHLHPPERPHPTRAGAGVVLLPIQGGDYEVTTWFAERFARAGFTALRFERRDDWLVADRPLSALPELMREYEEEVLEGVDAWLASGDVDPARVGLFGASMGAVVGTRVLAAEPRLGTAALCIGGGDLADVLLRARDQEIGQWRRDVASHRGVPAEALRGELEALLHPVDPLRVADRVRARTLFVSARFDLVVPWANNTRLWHALGRPRRMILPCGHYSAAVFARWIARRTVRWFDGSIGGLAEAPSD